MAAPSPRSSRYLYLVAAVILALVVASIFADSFKSRQVKQSLNAYMDNLRDLIFMSTYDSLKKGNMKIFKNHLEEVGTFNDVREFSLLDANGVVRYSSDPQWVKEVDAQVLGLQQQREQISDGFTTYYFPVETTGYCARCHPDWQPGSINSYYKLVLSRQALDAVAHSTLYYHGFTVLSGGVLLAFIFALHTLQERKRHQEKLLLSASVFENALEAIAVTSFTGLVEKINPAFARITGYVEEEILGRDIHLLNAGTENEESYRQMRAQLHSRGQWSGEMVNRRSDGTLFPVHLSVTAVRNAQRQITHYISIFYDTSADKAAERALVEMSRMKSEFISTAAHELRTPLSAMMGYTEFVRHPEEFGGFTTEQLNEFLDEIYDRGEALSLLIDDLLDISRIESGKAIELNLEETCLVGILARSVEFFKVYDTKHFFHIDLPPASPATLCRVDRYRINQVLENLLSNAGKYSPAGSEIVLRARLNPKGWEISVQDRGIGMNPEQTARIFDKFYRADSSNTAVSGLGLGMSIAKQIVEAHGGYIWVESEKGEGTTAYFTVPRPG